MSQTLIALSFWLHALATVLLVGHYLLLSAVYLPIFTKHQSSPVSGTILSEISGRSRNWMYVSLAIFVVTGIHLMSADPNYLGFADFGNLWGVLMLVKHILILGMLAMGFWFNGILRVGPLLASNSGAARAFGLMRLYANGMAAAGLLVLLLTAVSQAQ